MAERGGARPGAGNPGYGKLKFLKDKVEQHSPKWWTLWEQMVDSGLPEDKRFAMGEFNKLQIKMIPQDVDFVGDIVVKIAKQVADKYDTPPNTSESSGGQTPIQSN